MPLYPLKFHARFVQKMWGGRKLQTVLGKTLPPEQMIGESWELYDFPPGVVEKSANWISSPISNGKHAGKTLHWAVGEFSSDLCGDVPLVGAGQFPILIKFLDAREDLSVQVHPDRAYATVNPKAHLKTEAGYVLQNDPGARLLMGLTPGVNRQNLNDAINQGTVERLIQSYPAREGECYYLPSGTVHALGAGLLVAEVQTPSDTTFRVFDFNRIDPSTGQQRELHVREALQCIDFASPPAPPKTADQGARLVATEYFHIERIRLHPGAQTRIPGGEPTAVIVTQGSLSIGSELAARGEVVLLPAALSNTTLASPSGCTWLAVTFPR